MDTKKTARHSSHGAVTIFLAIILVPCIVLTCVLTDVSRVQLVKATSASAADLALDSLLGRYDETLKEYYGLVASCQTIDQFYDVSEKYFQGMLAAEGVDNVGSELFAAYMAELRNGDYSDFLRVEFPNSVEVTAAENGSLGKNPALIEDGIVEFMKYRGPYEISTNLIERFKNLDFATDLKDAKENEPIVKKKQDFAEAQGELLEAAFYSYVATKQYLTARSGASECPGESFYNALSSDFLKIYKDYQKVTELITLYYSGTDGSVLEPIQVFKFSLGAAKRKEDVGKKIEIKDDKGTVVQTVYCVTDTILNSLVNTYNNGEKVQKIKEDAEAIASAVGAVPAMSNDVNEAVHSYKMKEAIQSGSYWADLQSQEGHVKKLYSQLLGALACDDLPEGVDNVTVPDGWRDTVQTMVDEIEELYSTYLSSGGGSSFASSMDRYTQEAATVYSMVRSRSYRFHSEYLNQDVTIDDFTNAASIRLQTAHESLVDQEKRLSRVIDGGTISYNNKNKTVKKLDKLKSLIRQYSAKFTAWSNEANRHDNEYAKSEQEEAREISGQSTQDNQLAEALKEEDVDEMKTRLTNIRTDVKECISALESFKYGGKTVYTITNGTQAIEAARKAVPNNLPDISISSGKSQAASYFSSLISPQESQLYKSPHITGGQTGNEPNLEIDPPTLYLTLSIQFQNGESNIDEEIEDSKSVKQEYKDQKEEAKGKAEDVDGSVFNEGDKGGNIENASGGAIVSFNPITVAEALIDIYNNLMNGNGDEFRDKIYVCEYIMDMFGYSSYFNEGRFHCAQESNENLTVKDFETYRYNEQWNETDVTKFTDNKTLTNRMINAANNQANLGEVEYILYGYKEIDKNLNQSYKNIYSIRAALNLVSSFQVFYTQKSDNMTSIAIDSIANTVMRLTSGVVPACATKCVILATLTAFETAKDMDTLKKGAPVVLYKTTEKEWSYRIPIEVGGKKANFNAEADTDTTKGIYYSDYMYLFLLFGVLNDTTYSAMLQRTGDLIEANMKKENAAFDLDKAQCYFKLTAAVRVKPLMVSLSIADAVDGVDMASFRNATDWRTINVETVRGYS